MKATTLTAFASAMLISVAAFADTADAQQRGARGDGAKAFKGQRAARPVVANRALGGRRTVRQTTITQTTTTTTKTVQTRNPQASRTERTILRVLRTIRPVLGPMARPRRVATPGIDARIRRLTRRVDRATRRNAMPPRVARRMMNRINDVRAQRRVARFDGVVTQLERRRMRGALNRVNNRLSQFGA